MDEAQIRWRHRKLRGVSLSKVRGFPLALDEFGFIIGDVPDAVVAVVSKDRMFVPVDMAEIGKWKPIIAAAELALKSQEEAVSKAAQVLDAQRLLLEKRRRELSALISSMEEESITAGDNVQPADLRQQARVAPPAVKVAPPAAKVSAPSQKTHGSKRAEKVVTRRVTVVANRDAQSAPSRGDAVSGPSVDSDIDRALNGL